MLVNLRDRVRRFARRRRRVISAVFAGLAVLIIALPDTAPAQSTTSSPRTLETDEVALPVAFSQGASSLAIGDHIDLVGVRDDGTAHVIAHSARIISLPRSAGFGSTSDATMVAVTGDDALAVAAAGTTEQVTFLVRAH